MFFMILQKLQAGENLGSSWPNMLPANQIPVFLYHQYLWKESINTLDYLHGDNHEVKVGSETITFDWVWLVKLLI